MKKLNIILLILVFWLHFPGFVYSQSNDRKDYERLLLIINKLPVDSNTINAVYEMVWYFGNRTKYDSAKIFIDKVIAYATALKSKSGIGRGYHLNSFVFLVNNKYDSAKFYSQKAEKIFIEIRDTANLITAINTQGVICNYQSDYSEAVPIFLKSADILKSTSNTKYKRQEIEVYLNLGLSLAAENQFETALEYHKKALAMLHRLKGDAHLNRFTLLAHNYISESLIKLKRYKEAKPYLDSALALFPLVPNTDVQLTTLNIEGNYYQSINERTKALDVYSKALILFTNTKNEKIKGEITGTMASLFLRKKGMRKRKNMLKSPLPSA